MSWEQREVQKQRLEAAIRMERGDSPTQIARDLNRSREFVHKWHRRWKEAGTAGLVERSRAPKSSRRISAEMEQRIVELRERFPLWGPKKLLCLLRDQHLDETLPSRSTVANVLKRNGLVKPRRRRARTAPFGGHLTQPSGPNDVWTVDFKGHFKLQTGQYCYPLTVMDAYTRFALGWYALEGPSMADTRRLMDSLFQRHGLPAVIRTDNGNPFASIRSMHAMTRLSASWLAQGIRHERTRVGTPGDNAWHERMHRTMKAAACVPSSATFEDQQRRFDEQRRTYNVIRPHEALEMRKPAQLYRSSIVPFCPGPQPRYPAHFEVRRVYDRGWTKFANGAVHLGVALQGRQVGFEPLDGRLWAVHYFDYVLAEFDEVTRNVRPIEENREAFVRRPPQ